MQLKRTKSEPGLRLQKGSTLFQLRRNFKATKVFRQLFKWIKFDEIEYDFP